MGFSPTYYIIQHYFGFEKLICCFIHHYYYFTQYYKRGHTKRLSGKELVKFPELSDKTVIKDFSRPPKNRTNEV